MTSPGQNLIELTAAAVGSGGETKARLDDINWLVRRGDCWVVAAPASAGKTDLLATLAGLQPVLAGRCTVQGHDLLRLEPGELQELRRKIGFVFGEGGRLLSHLSIAENIALPLAYHGNRDLAECAAEVESWLTFTGLDDFAHRRPEQVGRVWRQRAALARALVQRPELLLLDNPIAGYDARQTGWWLETLAGLQRGHPVMGGRPVTLVVCVDDLRPWERHAGPWALIRQGRLSSARSRAELEAPDQEFLREWLGQAWPSVASRVDSGAAT